MDRWLLEEEGGEREHEGTLNHPKCRFPRRGAPSIFSRGRGEQSLHIQWPAGCEKSILRKVFTMLQASSTLAHSKKLKTHATKCNSRNLTE